MGLIFLLLFLWVCAKAVAGPQKIFARTSLALMLTGSLFVYMTLEKSVDAATLGSHIADGGFYLALVMLVVNLNWRMDVWLYERRRGRK